jgi:putative glutamine amidotransferase
MRPIIGITTYVESVAWGAWQLRPAALLPYEYVQLVAAAGGRAVLLPPDGYGADGADDLVAALDGLILSGGADVEPARYGAAPHPAIETQPERDVAELPVVRAALAADLPVLGVCRGMQVLSVACGGRLHQHLPDVTGHEGHRPAPGVVGAHRVRYAPGSRIASIMGADTEVNAYHHQGVADPGRLTPTAWAEDGLIEAVEDPARRFVLGVQWHPEVAGDVRPFAALAEAAAGAARADRALAARHNGAAARRPAARGDAVPVSRA